MLINLTNHPYAQWSPAQKAAAKVWGETMDLPFPAIFGGASEKDIELLASNMVSQVMALHPDAVCCQGEMTLTFRIVTLLKARGIRCVAACSEREVHETPKPDGTVLKTTVFAFVRFREY